MGDPRFRTTRWTLILKAAQASTGEARAALATLCERYWYPVYAFVRRRGYAPEDAQELTQEFFSRLIDKHVVQDARPERGRFRSFLLATVSDFLANEWDRAHTVKRGGRHTILPIDGSSGEEQYSLEIQDTETPETIFERQWAMSLLNRVLARLEEEQRAAGKLATFSRVKGLLAGEELDQSYRQIASGLGTTEGAVKVTVHRLRARYRALLRDEIADTVEHPRDIDDEIRHLLTVLSRRERKP
jgi:RNA polymerase sigma factor (sigma-70 family)